METYVRHYDHALRLLARFGGPATISREETTGGDPFDPSSGTTVTTRHDVTLLETGSTEVERSSGGSTILSSQLVGLLACAEDFTPSSSDRIVVAGQPGVVAISELSRVGPSPGGRPIVYEVVGDR